MKRFLVLVQVGVLQSRPSDGIGRHARLKILCFLACGFESRLGYLQGKVYGMDSSILSSKRHSLLLPLCYWANTPRSTWIFIKLYFLACLCGNRVLCLHSRIVY